MKNILITGGAGYIGSKITLDLIKKNYRVFIVDNLSTGHKDLIHKKALFFKCNIANKKKIFRILTKNNIDSVIHCAASLDIEESEKKPRKYFINNYLNTKKLLEVCVLSNVNNFIFSSTCAIYGNVSGKITETTKPKPISVYGKTKLKAENSIKKFSKKYKFNYGILRYFNVAGSDTANKIGCINKNNQLIKNLSTSIVNKKNFINIYGNNYNTKDGTCIRDYIFIDDLSKAHVSLLRIISKNKKSYVLNCGYGKGYSVLEIINSFEKYCKIKIKKFFLPRRKGDIDKIFASTSKIDKILKLNLKNKNRIKQIVLSSIKWEEFLHDK